MPPSKNVADRRRSSAAHVRSILDHTVDAVFALDNVGRVTFWNPRAEATFGWSRAEAVGAELAELILPPHARRAFLEVLASTRAAGEQSSRRLELEAARKDGSPLPVELALTAIPDGGDYAWSGYARDITQRRRDDAERERLLREAEHARAQAETASRAKDEFLSTLSHELRTPLTAIVGWTYLLRGGRLDENTTARGLEAIERNATAQAQVISDILDLSRIVGARFQLSVRPLQLAPVVAVALEPLMSAANAKQLRVQTVLDPEAGLVSGDPDRLRQVAWNLISNAIKFTPADGQITVRVERHEDDVRLVVEDTGEGIEAPFLPHVFERFRQADQSNTRSHGGLGLGLAVVRHLVELHGGSVEAASAGHGKGSRFTVTLPMLSAEDLPPAAPAPPASKGVVGAPPVDGITLDGVRVLVVDDGEDVREVVAGVLREHGAVVETAASAEEALPGITRFRPQVLVVEVEMKGESGLSLIRRVRALPADEGGTVPAAALSGFARTEDRVRALLAGFSIHLSKPVPPAELLAVVASLAGRPPRA